MKNNQFELFEKESIKVDCFYYKGVYFIANKEEAIIKYKHEQEGNTYEEDLISWLARNYQKVVEKRKI